MQDNAKYSNVISGHNDKHKTDTNQWCALVAVWLQYLLDCDRTTVQY